jgi:hypothetical protein
MDSKSNTSQGLGKTLVNLGARLLDARNQTKKIVLDWLWCVVSSLAAVTGTVQWLKWIMLALVRREKQPIASSS